MLRRPIDLPKEEQQGKPIELKLNSVTLLG
jgi:hypothetical protein